MHLCFDVLTHRPRFSEECLEINPKYAECWLKKGWALAELGRNQEALEALEKSLNINPENAQSWGFKAAVLIGLSRIGEAGKALKKAAEIDPEIWKNEK